MGPVCISATESKGIMNCMLFRQIIFGSVLLKSPEVIESCGSQPNCVALCQAKLPLKACGIFFSPVLRARRARSIVIFFLGQDSHMYFITF